MSYKGFFRPRNPKKYRGDPTNIIYRSGWELKLMMYVDGHPDILEWSSEEVVIPYRSPVDNKVHRYFPDFWIRKQNRAGEVEILLVEVKPYKETKPPPMHEGKQKPTKRYMQEVFTYGVNQAKWKAATEFCKDRKWKFVIMTEHELGIK